MTAPAAPAEMAVDRGVAVITLNRPDRGNAWTLEMQELYFDALDEATTDAEVRAIVVTGAGRAFCVGADTDVLDDVRDSGAIPTEPRGRAMHHPLSVPKPLIAAINGAAAGLGLVQALMADVRIAARSAKMTTSFVRRGLIAESGVSWLLPEIVGRGRASDLLLSGRVVLGDEAASIGLVERVVDDGAALDAAVDYALELARQSSPGAMAVIKRQLTADASASFAAAFDRAQELTAASLSGPDFAEGVRSFVERRAPSFPGVSTTAAGTP